jgi:hypothetical protein
MYIKGESSQSCDLLTAGSILLSRVGSFVRRLRPDSDSRARETIEFMNVDRDLTDFK